MNNYNLSSAETKKRQNALGAFSELFGFIKNDRSLIVFASIAALINTGLNLAAPLLIGNVIDTHIQAKNSQGLLGFALILLLIYLIALIANYYQTLFMGTLGQNLLYSLRNEIFAKLQVLPIAFFNQNKAGDLISRINSDTDKLNQFFSQSLIRFITSILTILGAAIFIVSIHWKLGLASLAPAALLFVFTRMLTPWIKRKNASNLQKEGGMSGEISESLDNFQVVVAFNRRDYFRKKFDEVNQENYKAAIYAGVANNTLTPAYTLASNAAQLIVLAYGIYLISLGDFTLGLLLSFLMYINRLYDPLKEMASVWSSFQTALAGWDRINSILSLETDLALIPEQNKGPKSTALLEFQDVDFSYPDGKAVLKDTSLSLEAGKTYALVGPTGGGKTTTASLMARLYDPTAGRVLLNGKDIRSYSTEERTEKIGFILQEPFLFTGTIRENILVGNERYLHFENAQLEELIEENNLSLLLARFEDGLETKVTSSGSSLSVGQKQLIAFMRAVLRHPDLLILDEATANIDTVTEQLLDEILNQLPQKTTRVIIAHRLNTIKNAAEIFFINNHKITKAGSMEDALSMLLHGKRES